MWPEFDFDLLLLVQLYAGVNQVQRLVTGGSGGGATQTDTHHGAVTSF